MPFDIPDTIKQRNRYANVSNAGFFFVADSFDINNGVRGFQPAGAPSLDEFSRYIVTDPSNLHADYGTIAGVGTGDIIECLQDEDRERRGITFEIVMDASNTGDLVTSQSGQVGTLIFNLEDLSSYIFNGATWEKVQVGPEGSGPGGGGGNTYYGGTGLALSTFVTNVGQTFSIDSSAVIEVAGISASDGATFYGGITLGGGITFADGTIQRHAGFSRILIGAASDEIKGGDYYDGDFSTLVLSDSDSVSFVKGTLFSIPYIQSNVNVDDSTIEISANNGLQLKDGGVSNTKLSNSSVTINAGAGLDTTNSSVSLGGSSTLSINVDNSTIELSGDLIRVKDGGVSNTKLASSSVTNAKIANSAVTAAKISSDNVVKSISVSNGVEFTSGDGQDNVNIGGINAQADSSTKGVAAFDSDDFSDNDAGVISLKAGSGVGPSWYVKKVSDDNDALCDDAGAGEFLFYPYLPNGGYRVVATKTDVFGRYFDSWFENFNSIYLNNDFQISITFRKLSDNSTATFTWFDDLTDGFENNCASTPPQRFFENYQNIDESGTSLGSFIGSGATCEITVANPLTSSTFARYHYKGTNTSNPGSSPPGDMTVTSLVLPPAGGGTGGAFTLKINNQDIDGRDQRTTNMNWSEYVGDRPFTLKVLPAGFSGDNPPRGGFTAGKQIFEINSGQYVAPNYVFTGSSCRFENDGLTAGNFAILSFDFPNVAGSSATGETGDQGPTGPTGPTGPVGDYVESFNSLTGAVDTTSLTLNVAGLSASNGISAGTVQSARYHEDVYDNGNVSGSIALSFANGNVQTATVIGTGTNTFSLINVPAPSGSKAGSMTLLLTDGGTGSSTVWHSSIKWPGGVEPTLTGSGIDIISFVTYNNNLYGFVGGLNFS